MGGRSGRRGAGLDPGHEPGHDHGQGVSEDDGADEDVVGAAAGPGGGVQGAQAPDQSGDREPEVAGERPGRGEARGAGGADRAADGVVTDHDGGQGEQHKADEEAGAPGDAQQAGAQQGGRRDGAHGLLDEGPRHGARRVRGGLETRTDERQHGEQQPQRDAGLDRRAAQPQQVSPGQGDSAHGPDVHRDGGGAPVKAHVDRAQDQGAEEGQDLAGRLGHPGDQGQASQGAARGRQKRPGLAHGHGPLQGDDRAQEADEHDRGVKGRERGAAHRRPHAQPQQRSIETGQEAGAAQAEDDEPGPRPGRTGSDRRQRVRGPGGGGRTWVLRHTRLTFFHIGHRNKIAAGRAMTSRRASAHVTDRAPGAPSSGSRTHD